MSQVLIAKPLPNSFRTSSARSKTRAHRWEVWRRRPRQSSWTSSGWTKTWTHSETGCRALAALPLHSTPFPFAPPSTPLNPKMALPGNPLHHGNAVVCTSTSSSLLRAICFDCTSETHTQKSCNFEQKCFCQCSLICLLTKLASLSEKYAFWEQPDGKATQLKLNC